MFVPDVLTRQDFSAAEADQPAEPAMGPELWPVGAIDVLLVVVGLVLAHLLAVFG